MDEDKGQIFWLENFHGEGAKGGYFVRNPLKEFVEKLDKVTPKVKVVGIRYDGSYNLEILVVEENQNV